MDVRQITPQPSLPPVAPDAQVLKDEVTDGKLGADRCTVRAGAAHIEVTAPGRLYSMHIDQVMQDRTLRANQATRLGVTAETGEYTMRLNAGVEDTTALNVRPMGGR